MLDDINIDENPYLVRFNQAQVPSVWRSRQAETMYKAAMEGEAPHSVDWASYAFGSVWAAYEPADAIMSPYGTSNEAALNRALAHADALERKAKEIRAFAKAYGGFIFVLSMHRVRAPKHPFDAQEFLCSILAGKPTHVKLNGRLFARDRHGVLRRQDTPA